MNIARLLFRFVASFQVPSPRKRLADALAPAPASLHFGPAPTTSTQPAQFLLFGDQNALDDASDDGDDVGAGDEDAVVRRLLAGQPSRPKSLIARLAERRKVISPFLYRVLPSFT